MPWPEQTTGRTSGATLLKHVHYRGGFAQTQATARKRLFLEAFMAAAPPVPTVVLVPATPFTVMPAAPLALLAVPLLAAMTFAAVVPVPVMMAVHVVTPAGLRLPPHASRRHAGHKRDGDHHDRHVHDRLGSVRRERTLVAAVCLVLTAPAPMAAAMPMAPSLRMVLMAAMLMMATALAAVTFSVFLFLGHRVSPSSFFRCAHSS